MVEAIILAAGKSERMGRAKALLACEEGTFVERIIGVLERSKVGRISVVLGHEAERIMAGADVSGVRVVVNADYELGQLSSLQAGLRGVGDDAEGVVVCLVDHPLIEVETVDALTDAFERTAAPIVLPRYEGRRGHPVLFSRAVFAELMDAPLDAGARHVVHAHEAEIVEVATDDAGVRIGIHTEEDYERQFGRKR